MKNSLICLQNMLKDREQLQRVDKVAELMSKAFQEGNKILVCGNGGSCTDAMHFAEELTGRFRQERPALPAIALADASHITCVGNDYGFENIFARGVEAYGRKGDCLLVISTSGNSTNIIKAVLAARTRNMHTIALTGKAGGRLRELSEYLLIVPGDTTDRIQEMHGLILHILIELIERRLFPQNYQSENG
ncbi:MAG: D-sedoheptulose 7-phosphate isomerase [Candidatus Cloacimonetes bacterium]|nr:D-sedoheptulose 7-phosphate isomerase [Candidatus Cloacimonadota bacterium]